MKKNVGVNRNSDEEVNNVIYKNCGITVVEGKKEEPTTPTNVKVTLNPSENITVKQGQTSTFTATVTGDNLTDKSVTWNIEGAKSSNTKIVDGKLTIGSDETAEKITVKAVSVADNTAVASVSISVEKVVDEKPTEPVKPTNVKVSLTPSESVTVKQGKTVTFTATVTGDNLTDKSVTWNIEGAKSSKTKIADGKLTVGSDETAEKLTVKAVSVADSTAIASVSVSVEKIVVEEQTEPTEPAKPTNVKVTITPSTNVTIIQGKTASFEANVTGDNLTDKSVKWSIEGAKSSNTKITSAGKLTIGSDETAEKIVVKATSKADNTVSATVSVSVKKKAVTNQQQTNNSNNNNNNNNNSNNNNANNNNNQNNVVDENIPATGSNSLLIGIICISALGIIAIKSYDKFRY